MPAQPVPQDIELHTDGVMPLLAGFEAFPSVAKAYLTKHGIAQVDAQGRLAFDHTWIPLYLWLSTLNEILNDVGPNSLFKAGTRIMENARFPPWLDNIESALQSLDVSYHQIHRRGGQAMFDPATGCMLEGIGHYGYDRAAGKNEIRIICDALYPCPADFGIVTGLAKRFEPRAITTHDFQVGCRTQGDACCVYVVTW